MAASSKRSSLRGSRRRSPRQRRWPWVLFGIYLAGLFTVLGVLAEQRWGWLPVRARSHSSVEDRESVPPRGIPAPAPGTMSSRWSDSAVARGWEAGGLHSGFIPAPLADAAPHVSMAGASGVPQPGWSGPDESLEPGLRDVKVLNLEPPDFSGLKRR